MISFTYGRAVARAAAICALACGACGDETGVLVEISRDEATTSENLATLEVVIGVSRSEGGRHVRDESSVTDIDVTGRDLVGKPYELLVRDGTGGEASLMIAVIGYENGQPVAFAGFEAPQGFKDGQVLRRRLTLVGDAPPRTTPTGCVQWFAPGDVVVGIASPSDLDCDGDPVETDCNDEDPSIGPSQTELCADGIDQDCDEMIDEPSDADMDGVTNCDGDCDDNDAMTYPGAPEICDAKDNDCNDVCDDGALDEDGDRYNTCGEKILEDGTCKDEPAPDCNDKDAAVFPGNPEVCDGKDNDCDEACDVAPDLDVDMDGLTVCGTKPGECAPPVMQLEDCDDGNPAVKPGNDELCDGVDSNCDGVRLEHEGCYATEEMQCRLGARACDDDKSDGSFGLAAECVTTDEVAVPPGFCAAYQTCDQMMVPDRFECANEAQATGNPGMLCTLNVKVGLQLALCPNRGALLPANMLANECSWSVLGGAQQDHYVVGVGGEGAVPAASSAVCAALFSVVDKRDFIPQAEDVVLLYDDNTLAGPRAVQVGIVPALVTNCPENGLTCQMVMP